MKSLTRKDLLALASLIRKATHRKVVVSGREHLSIMKEGKFFAKVMIKKGRALATDIIPGFQMKSFHPRPSSCKPFHRDRILRWRWQILI